MQDIHSSTDEYARRFSGPVGDFFNQVEINAVLDLLQRWPRSKVLDVGGGHARIAVPLVKLGCQVTVTGSDTSCRRRLDRFLPEGGFDFVQCEPTKLPFEKGAFDVVISTRIITHEENWELLLEKMCYAAREAVLLDFSPLCSFNCISGLLFPLKLKIEKTTRTFRIFRQAVLRRELTRQGFRIERARAQFLLPMALHRLCGSAGLSRTMEAVFRVSGLTRSFGAPILLLATRVGRLG